MDEITDSEGRRYHLQVVQTSVGVVDEGGQVVVKLPLPWNWLHKVGVVDGTSVQWLEYENLRIWTPEHVDTETVLLDRALTAEAVAGGGEALAVLARHSGGTGIFRVESDGSTAHLTNLHDSPTLHERKLIVVGEFVVWALKQKLCCISLGGGEEHVLARAETDGGFEVIGVDDNGHVIAETIGWRVDEFGMRAAERQGNAAYPLPGHAAPVDNHATGSLHQSLDGVAVTDALAAYARHHGIERLAELRQHATHFEDPALRFEAEYLIQAHDQRTDTETPVGPIQEVALERFDELGLLSPRLLSALENAGIFLVGQLAVHSTAELRKCRGIGPSAITALESILDRRGLQFGASYAALGQN